MTLASPGSACYCRCCCLSDDPADSEDMELPHGPYNRRYDCSCKQRWYEGCTEIWEEGLKNTVRALKMRARDLGKTKEASDAMVIEDALTSLVEALR